MGKGDKKSRKGKIAMGSYDKTRPHHVKKATGMPGVAKEPVEDTKPEKAKKPSV